MGNIVQFGDLAINGQPVALNSEPTLTDGAITRMSNPQINGDTIITQDISTNKSTISIPVMCNPENNELFDTFFANGNNNVITYDGKNYSSAVLTVKPERKNMEEATYVFESNPPA
tara:strand:- start:705 stop:1052 length:348 start_codon:yes stop_codon:yes gene_type:complete